MEFIRGIGNLRERHRNCVATIGNYDGVHRGHQAVIAAVIARAQQLGCPSAAVVFEPTPQEFFTGSRAPARLTTLREKLQQLDASGLDRVLCVRFNRRVASMSPQQFIDRLIKQGLAVRHLTVGADFRFGRDRGGDFAMLVAAGETLGFGVTAIDDFALDGDRVSSSAVREALARGDLQLAARLLGRAYSMSGRVQRGQQLGRRLGFPTANIPPRRRVLPLHGVFAVRVGGVTDTSMPGVASLGVRPMVDGVDPLLEVHLFDFDADIYGCQVQVEFVERLREERVFTDLHAMVDQMHEDAARARELLGVGPAE
ncbi:MAG: bifunctional riboflavin kinase/FAD synthetase [Gammaproteobacteria bacterium]|nr:bifunctional riboflavin kinase/FAD synthetase [Gammaproteobacteria bacterium]NNF61677.1 bifunctional riboflavin kinase/FAD synthetase [Gammaproteobacteria bacterium]NNM20307.1 bifunctional riboflavin kinase/FAD synthetase [Gammaproteobacteria bacterium]